MPSSCPTVRHDDANLLSSTCPPPPCNQHCVEVVTIKGDKGDKGDTGDTGATGATGAVGPKGDKGDKGDTGASGANGVNGADGATGPAGATGAQGPAGQDGAGGNPLTSIYPLIGARAGTIDTSNSNHTAVFDTFVNQQLFGASIGASSFTVPTSGWYFIANRATCSKTVATAPACSVAVYRNGTALPTLGINFGVNFFPWAAVNEIIENEKTMSHYLNAGDVITVESGTMGAGAVWMADTLNITWVSA